MTEAKMVTCEDGCCEPVAPPVKMNPAVKAKWVAALRSGDYKQGRGALKATTFRGDEFCCLGVLCDISLEELKLDIMIDEETGLTYFNKNRSTLPASVQGWADLSEYGELVMPVHPYYGGERIVALTGLNDQGKSFEEIADLIEQYL